MLDMWEGDKLVASLYADKGSGRTNDLQLELFFWFFDVVCRAVLTCTTGLRNFRIVLAQRTTAQ